MSTITSLINSSPTYKAQVKLIIDDTLAFLGAPNKTAWLEAKGIKIDANMKRELEVYEFVDEIFPMVTEESFRVLAIRILQNMSIASITAADQPVPITGTGSIEEAITNLFKVSIGLSWNEQEQIRFAELLQIYANQQDVLMKVYKNIEDLPKKVIRTFIVLTYQLVTTGRVFYRDPRTGILARMDFNFMPSLFPAALSGSNAWNQPNTANGIENIQAFVNNFYDANGYIPLYLGAHYKTWQALCRQQSTKDTALGLGLVTGNPTGTVQVSMRILKAIFEDRGFPIPVSINAQYELEVRPGTRRRVNFVPEGTIFMASPNMGQRVLGQTIESKKGKQDGKYSTGVFVDLDPRTETEVEDRVTAVARGIPHTEDPKALSGWVVYAA